MQEHEDRPEDAQVAMKRDPKTGDVEIGTMERMDPRGNIKFNPLGVLRGEDPPDAMKSFTLSPEQDDAYGRASRVALWAYAEAIREHDAPMANYLNMLVVDIESEKLATENGLRPDEVRQMARSIAMEVLQETED